MPETDERKGSIPKSNFHNAALAYFRGMGILMKPEPRQTIQVYEIARDGDFELHLSAIYQHSVVDMNKFHFTIRKGPGKGTDAFAWYEITGYNKAATLSERMDRGDTTLFNLGSLPPGVRHHVKNIDLYAHEIFKLAVGYSMPVHLRD